MKISIGSDHAGFQLKQEIINYLKALNFVINDRGCYSEDRVDYPDFGHAVAIDIIEHNADLGILICGSGNGINMAANKHAGIRSALCWNREIAQLAKAHNNANIIALPARFISKDVAISCVEDFIKTPFEGGRHQDRIVKINC
jgi:ribose 5-phosphate isomerase B